MLLPRCTRHPRLPRPPACTFLCFIAPTPPTLRSLRWLCSYPGAHAIPGLHRPDPCTLDCACVHQGSDAPTATTELVPLRLIVSLFDIMVLTFPPFVHTARLRPRSAGAQPQLTCGNLRVGFVEFSTLKFRPNNPQRRSPSVTQMNLKAPLWIAYFCSSAALDMCFLSFSWTLGGGFPARCVSGLFVVFLGLGWGWF